MEKMTRLQPRSSSSGADTLTTQARRSFAISIAAFIAALLIVIQMTYLIIRHGYWQMYFVIGAAVLFMGLCIAALLFSRRGKPTVSGWLMISGIFIVVVVLSLFVRNIGGGASIVGLFAILYIAIETLPQRQVPWATFLGVLALVFTRLLDAFPLLTTATDASLERVVQGAVVMTLLVLGILIIREFKTIALTNKLLVAFLVVAIVVTYATNYLTRVVLAPPSPITPGIA